jgi:hypothetical protein
MAQLGSQSVIDSIGPAGAGFARIAEYSRLALGLPRHGTCERMPQFCAAAQPS